MYKKINETSVSLSKLIKLAIVSLVAFAGAASAADTWPDEPIKIIVSYPASGSVDATARILQEPLSRILGQPIIIENKGGAGGTIATRFVSDLKPDGYTFLMTLSSHTINPAIYATLPFDTETDFAAVSLVSSSAQVLVANPSFGPSSVQELIEFVRNSPKEIPYASPGIGSPGHIAGELFKQRAGDLKLLNIPYRGGGPAVVDILGGQVPLLWVSLPAVSSFIKKGDLKAIAVSTLKRTPLMPDIPAMSETLEGFNVDTWYAIFAPKGTPQSIITKMNNAVKESLKEEKVVKSLASIGAVPVGSSPQELQDIVIKEIPLWKELANKSGIRVN